MNKEFTKIDISKKNLPIKINFNLLSKIFKQAQNENSPILSVVIGTKPDFYKQAPLVVEAKKEGLPVFVIDTGQHFDDILGFGIKEFNLEKSVGCDLQIRGDLMEKASELILKFGSLGRYCKDNFNFASKLLPIVHGDTLVAGIAPLAWVFGMGQKVAQNEAGLRSMSPNIMNQLKVNQDPTLDLIEKFIHEQFNGKWFIAREEPFPEQIDTWICSAGTQYFFAPTHLNKEHLIREGYPEEFIHVVGNSVVDAIDLKRKEKSNTSIFDIYPKLEEDRWIRMDIHRRENLTEHRFKSIIHGLINLIKYSDHKVVLVMLNATKSALKFYNLENEIKKLSEQYPNKFLITPLWKEYGQVIEFLDSGHCWAEMTDSGSMQEELLYFQNVLCMTVRLNTDRPETIFEAKSNILIPPINSEWIPAMVNNIYDKSDDLGIKTHKKEQIYGKPGEVSKNIAKIIKKQFEDKNTSFYPWFHQRINLWREDSDLQYM